MDTTPSVKKKLEIISKSDLKIGDMFFELENEYIIIISKIENGYVFTKRVDPETKQIIGEWGSNNMDEFIKEYGKLYISDYDDLKKRAEYYLFEKKNYNIQKGNDTEKLPINVNNKNTLSLLHSDIERKTAELNAVKNMTNYLIRQQMKKLNKIKEGMNKQLEIFEKEMDKIEKVIGMIELYMGIKEEIVQIKEGAPADAETPISLRQLVLYADEELGNCEDGGIDYSNLCEFDDWIQKNYPILLPEEKGVVALKPRRYDKDYGDVLDNAILNVWNHQTYFLIRNGKNIYRICSEHIAVGTTMFPKKDEYKKIMQQESSSKKEKFYDSYTKMALLIQGLIDRTDVFKPLQPNIKISDIENKYLNLIYDAEVALPTGRMPFLKWKDSINETVKKGSRIVLIPSVDRGNNYYKYMIGCGHEEGFLRYYNNEWSAPKPPVTGLYTLENLKNDDGEELLGILYMPKEEDNWWKERKNRVGWVVNLEDSWYLNYDRISLKDIDFYINSRIDRPNYLKNLPLLRELRRQLIKEEKMEGAFKKMLLGLALSQNLAITEEDISKAIDWWKYKNIWKRPITEDDAKAVRMIKTKLQIK